MEESNTSCTKPIEEIHLCHCKNNFKTCGSLSRLIRWNIDKYICNECKTSTPLYSTFVQHYKNSHHGILPSTINHILYQPSSTLYVRYTSWKTFKLRHQHEYPLPQAKPTTKQCTTNNEKPVQTSQSAFTTLDHQYNLRTPQDQPTREYSISNTKDI